MSGCPRRPANPKYSPEGVSISGAPVLSGKETPEAGTGWGSPQALYFNKTDLYQGRKFTSIMFQDKIQINLSSGKEENLRQCKCLLPAVTHSSNTPPPTVLPRASRLMWNWSLDRGLGWTQRRFLRDGDSVVYTRPCLQNPLFLVGLFLPAALLLFGPQCRIPHLTKLTFH